MDYFVSTTAGFNHFWQTELLIESFKKHNLQNNLLIAINNDNGKYLPNLNKHQRKFSFIHNECPQANKIYALLIARNQNLLTPQFAFIHPDCVLMKPLENYKENVVFHPTPEDPELKGILPPDLPWITIDGMAVFKDVPDTLFHKVYLYLTTDKFKDRQLSRFAWTSALKEYLGLITMKGTELEINLYQHNQEQHFVHYRTGMNPYFNKINYGDSISLTDDTPFQKLIDNNPTSVTNYLKNIVLTYLGK